MGEISKFDGESNDAVFISGILLTNDGRIFVGNITEVFWLPGRERKAEGEIVEVFIV